MYLYVLCLSQLVMFDKQNSVSRASLKGHALEITSCAIVYDPGNIESTVLATSSKDGTVRLWDGACIVPASSEEFKQPVCRNKFLLLLN